MSSLSVVKDFNILKDGPSGLIFAVECHLVDQLFFQGAEERFHHGIIKTVPLAAHTLTNMPCFEYFPHRVAGILTPTI